MAMMWCIVFLIGLWFLASAIMNWEWFHVLDEIIVALAVVGLTGARIIIGVTGLVLMGVGISGVVKH